MPSSPLRRQLRAAGHHLSPVVQVGKEGVTEAVLRQLDRALLDHELVKVKMGTETPDDRFASAEALAAGAEGAHLAQILGRTLLVYRRHPEKPRFEPLPVVGATGLLGGFQRRDDRVQHQDLARLFVGAVAQPNAAPLHPIPCVVGITDANLVGQHRVRATGDELLPVCDRVG